VGQPVADLFRQVAQLNQQDPRREGNVLHLQGDERADCLVVGDLHGHRKNLTRVLGAADLPNHPDRCVVLQELIHGPDDARSGTDRSIELLMRAARLKVQHPAQVVMILANHDLAEITGNEITKEGRGCCEAFGEGLVYAFGEEHADEIAGAMCEMLLSQPLAVRTAGGVMACHTLPSPGRMAKAGTEILARPYEPEDLTRGGAVYDWVWGRSQTPEQIEALAAELDVQLFVIAHTHVTGGAERIGERCVIITDDHEQGQVFHALVNERIAGDAVLEHIHPVIGLKGSI
jgi:Icc-related predicted phosphoesterase